MHTALGPASVEEVVVIVTAVEPSAGGVDVSYLVAPRASAGQAGGWVAAVKGALGEWGAPGMMASLQEAGIPVTGVTVLEEPAEGPGGGSSAPGPPPDGDPQTSRGVGKILKSLRGRGGALYTASLTVAMAAAVVYL